MTNSKNNQHCFNCASFQPYENANPVSIRNGECRWCPQVGELVEPTPTRFNQYWPYIENGDDFWCSKWKLSAQTAITTGTPVPPTWPADWSAFQANPWNRRAPLNQSCWSCNHYQYQTDPPILPGDNKGQCRKGPPPAVLDLAVGVTLETLEPGKFVYAGSDFFCSAWERNQGTVPVDPGPAS